MLNSTRGRCGARYAAISVTSPGRICRWSSRGCTVIPAAPARTHVSTASSTLGTDPPREFLSVATLLTLTERLIIDVYQGKRQKAESPSIVCALCLVPCAL